jgi:ribosomal protein S6--L-glutamate ligase
MTAASFVTLGVAANPYAMNAPTAIAKAASAHGVPTRMIDVESIGVTVTAGGITTVTDRDGPVVVDALAPALLFGFPAAVHAFRVLEQRAYLQNPVAGTLAADDKAHTAELLAVAGIPQVPTRICALDLAQVLTTAAAIGYPVVAKRTHGAQGRWVRRAYDEPSLVAAYDELASEGPGALVLQPLVAEVQGTSVRAVVTGGRLLATTERTAADEDWRSNVAGGASQRPVELTEDETEAVLGAARALDLRHAGVDLLRTAAGSFVLEVNSCPDFTSMLPHFDTDLAHEVMLASLAPPAAG